MFSQVQIAVWLVSFRPKTLLLSFVSILTGIVLANFCGYFRWDVALLALLTAEILQILCNLANDYGDALKGADKEKRLGPLRGIQTGGISLSQMKKALFVVIMLALLCGVILIFIAFHQWRDMVSFIAFGLIAIIAAITYTVGPAGCRPYGYVGFGDIAVFIFFGLLSVIGTFYLLTTHFDSIVILPAIINGLLATAVLNINNLRDIESDKKCGKNTIIVKLGAQYGRYYHCCLLIGVVLSLFIFALIYTPYWQGWLFLLALPLIFRHLIYVMTHKAAEEMVPMLGDMVKVALLTTLLFCAGLFFG